MTVRALVPIPLVAGLVLAGAVPAVAGVTDAGGNRAAGNGNPLQCVGVTCR